jgi:hypothetical protein
MFEKHLPINFKHTCYLLLLYYLLIQILYSTYHKPNGGILNSFIMKHKKNFNLFFYVYVENCHILNIILGECTFWSNLPCLLHTYTINFILVASMIMMLI